MNGKAPSSWSSSITKAVGILVIAAIVLYVVERIFWAALPTLLVLLALVCIYRLALGMFRRDGW